MIYPDAEMRRDIMCIGGTSQWPATLFRGIDQWGERYGYLLIDPIGGAIGAFAHGDGINTGGQSRTPRRFTQRATYSRRFRSMPKRYDANVPETNAIR